MAATFPVGSLARLRPEPLSHRLLCSLPRAAGLWFLLPGDHMGREKLRWAALPGRGRAWQPRGCHSRDQGDHPKRGRAEQRGNPNSRGDEASTDTVGMRRLGRGGRGGQVRQFCNWNLNTWFAVPHSPMASCVVWRKYLAFSDLNFCVSKMEGAPFMAQQLTTQLVSMRMGVQSLASLCGLGIRCCHELRCRSQMRLESHVAVAVVLGGGYSFSLTLGLGTSICHRCIPTHTHTHTHTHRSVKWRR